MRGSQIPVVGSQSCSSQDSLSRDRKPCTSRTEGVSMQARRLQGLREKGVRWQSGRHDRPRRANKGLEVAFRQQLLVSQHSRGAGHFQEIRKSPSRRDTFTWSQSSCQDFFPEGAIDLLIKRATSIELQHKGSIQTQRATDRKIP